VLVRKTPFASLLTVLLTISLVLAACGDDDDTAAETTATVADDADAGEARRTGGIDYTGTGSFRRMDVWAPRSAGDWPVVIIVPGVGQQSKASFQPLAQAIAEEGAVVLNIDVDDSVPFITAIEQVSCAVRYANVFAAQYGGDPGRVVLVGNSMGASVSAVVALAGESFPGPCAAEGGTAFVSGLVGYEGAYDYVRESDYLMVDHRYLEEDDPEMFTAIDPYTHLDGNPDLVVRLVHGVDDDVLWYDVPPGESVAFADALEQAGHDCDLTLLEGAAHIDLWDSGTTAFTTVVDTVMEVAGN
jgi:acetyl esterase/lipase